ncbi:MAG: hypothetical protein IKM47_02930 [Bacteroidaceae bacterium]|nr:hypothetical protein [Bacteroidaceae bacterium]
MVIQLVSYKSTLRADSRLRHTAEIINSSKADMILFAGHTLASHRDVDELNTLIVNDKATAVIEVKKNAISVLNPVCNSLFLLRNGVVKDMFTHQLFTDSKTINAYPELGDHLMLELETRRNFSAANRNVSIIQCGENNILRNVQSEGNRAVFRFEHDAILNQRFADYLNNTDIILNPMHSPMGNQPKMCKRREFFSDNNRAYFSTANYDDEESIYNKSVQYACFNGKEQEPKKVEVGKRNSYIVRTFVI